MSLLHRCLVPLFAAHASSAVPAWRRRWLFALCALCLPITLAAQPQTETSRQIGDYTVHFIAVNSTFLDPAIAARYGLERGQRQAFLNIAVLGPEGTPMAARVSGSKATLLGETEELRFQEVREEQAIYYLGPFDFNNAEMLRFRLDIQPEGERSAFPLEWNTRVYIN